MVKPQAVAIDTKKYRAYVGKKQVCLTPKEFDLLRILTEARGVVKSRADLADEVWGTERSIDTRTVDQHIARLRKKLGVCVRGGNYVDDFTVIRTVPTRGYAVEGVKVL